MNTLFARASVFAFLLLFFFAFTAPAAAFPSEFDLADLDGENGFALQGAEAGDHSGLGITGLGDVNGDGIDDIAIGARERDLFSNFGPGKVSIVFGRPGNMFPAAIDFDLLNGVNGFTIVGEHVGDSFGVSVAGVGDVNGDGRNDILIGADQAQDRNGVGYLFYGRDKYPAEISIGNVLNNAVKLVTTTPRGDLGFSVSRAGDVNGDGFADLLLGAFNTGRAYVVYGGAGLPNEVTLDTLTPTTGAIIDSDDAFSSLGVAVAPLNDVNRDGFDDVIIGGSRLLNADGDETGGAYVVFGGSALPSIITDTYLDGMNGFVAYGTQRSDFAGASVGSAGDLNGDGFLDIAIGAITANGEDESFQGGQAYVIFGTDQTSGGTFSLADLNGSNGFVLYGEAQFDWFGHSVAGVGDLDGDGVDDVVVGAPDDVFSIDVGKAYVVFGAPNFPRDVFVSQFDGDKGFVINGVSGGDKAGFRSARAGDFNADGRSDMLLNAYLHDPDGRSNAGESYVIFGE